MPKQARKNCTPIQTFTSSFGILLHNLLVSDFDLLYVTENGLFIETGDISCFEFQRLEHSCVQIRHNFDKKCNVRNGPSDNTIKRFCSKNLNERENSMMTILEISAGVGQL